MTGSDWIDAGVEFIWNGVNFMLGYTVANGQIITPTKSAWLVGVLTGLAGAVNHIRALRKKPS